jgi:hypothetical protein
MSMHLTSVTRAVRKAPCPLCGARSGQRCTKLRGKAGNVGKPTSSEHAGRFFAAVDAGYIAELNR